MKQKWMKNTAVFLTSQSVSLIGSSIVQYAITWYITLEYQSGFYEMISIICGFLPTFLLAPFAGVWADRYNRKTLIILADGSIALCTLLLAIAFLSGHNSLWLLFLASIIRALGAAVQMPCVGAMLPDIVPQEQLTRINGINGTVQSIIGLLSPMLGGAMFAFASIEYIFFIDVITAVIAILIMLFFFKIPARQKSTETPVRVDYFTDLKQGFAYVLKEKYLRNFFIFCTGFFFLACPGMFLTTLQISRTYNGDVWHLSVLEIVFSIGMLIGGILMSTWGGTKNHIVTIAIAGFIIGACTFGLGLPIPLWVYFSLMGVFGITIPFVNVPANVLLQERVSPDYIGRVFGVMTMISTSIMPLGMLIFGPLADYVSIEILLIITGILIFAGSSLLFINKPLLKAGKRKAAASAGQDK